MFEHEIPKELQNTKNNEEIVEIPVINVIE